MEITEDRIRRIEDIQKETSIFTKQNTEDIKKLQDEVSSINENFNNEKIQNSKTFSEIKSDVKEINQKVSTINVFLEKLEKRWEEWDKTTKGNYNALKMSVATGVIGIIFGLILAYFK
jgi:chromosome segregation ATPase